MAVLISVAILGGFALAMIARGMIKSAEASQKARVAREDREREELEAAEEVLATPKPRRRKRKS